MKFNPQSHTRFRVEGMDCGSCALKIENALKRVDGAGETVVNVGAGTVTVASSAGFDQDVAAQAIRKLGYAVRIEKSDIIKQHAHQDGHGDHCDRDDHNHDAPEDRGKVWWKTAKGRLVITSGALLAVSIFAAQFFPMLGLWPFVAATLIALLPIASRALTAAQSGSIFTIEMLMTIAALGALAINAAEEAAVVVFLFAVGELLEGVAATQARKSISALTELTPKTAIIVENDRQREVAAEILEAGQIVLVRPGDRIACDGVIEQGSSEIDESPVTGESLPRAKSIGDEVFAGTINLGSTLKLRVTRAAADNTIARIIRLVEEAQSAKAPVQRFVDKFARIYMPIVVGIAVLVAVVPPLALGGAWGIWIYRALSLLLIACPCALVISTPAAIAAGLSAGARRGLLIKGGAVLEEIGNLRTIAFDKTGTLTEGKPQVTDIQGVTVSDDETLRLVAALESGSNHPIARAVATCVTERGITSIPSADNIEALSGRGLSGMVGTRKLWLVSPRAAVEQTSLPEALQNSITALENEGKTVALLLEQQNVLGLFAVRDEPRQDAKDGLKALAALGITGIMLTGDNRRTADAVAASLGIEAHAELLPEDKARIVKELQDSGRGPVGKVGDGINDAPALAAASVGIAMGGGTDVALETANAALLSNSVMGVADLVGLSRATLATIRVNVALALGSKAIFLVTTILGVTGMWIAVMADTGATVLVTLNALRLLRYRFKV